MLIEDLGYRRPTPKERSHAFFRAIRQQIRPTDRERQFEIPSAVLHRGPLISYSGIVPDAPLGIASLCRFGLNAQKAWFLVSPTWSIEKEDLVRIIRKQTVTHRLVNPGHRFVFLCNTEKEVEMLRAAGEAAMLHNKTTTVADTIFRPLDQTVIEFDAIYNAQLARWKRHELTHGIERCAFLFYRGINTSGDDERNLIARHLARSPRHEFINELDETGCPVRLPPDTVNRHLNRAAVGLCLSEVEGAMFACAEYLLAGLPIVTTPNKGGRDYYFNDDFCIKVPADQRSVADAVKALKDRKIPRDHIRKETLKLVSAGRRDFVDLVNTILDESRSGERLAGGWPFRDPVIMKWRDWRAAREHLVSGQADDLGHHFEPST